MSASAVPRIVLLGTTDTAASFGELAATETIVVGVDGSEGGAAAHEFAAAEAAFRGARRHQVVQHATCPVVVVNQPTGS